MELPTASALIFGGVASLTVVFQLGLSLGAPWGELTLGGRHRGALPGAWRLVPLLSIVLLTGFTAIVLARAGLILAEWHDPSRTLIWVVVGYCAVGCIANAATPSPRERRLWLPVVALMLATSLVVALS